MNNAARPKDLLRSGPKINPRWAMKNSLFFFFFNQNSFPFLLHLQRKLIPLILASLIWGDKGDMDLQMLASSGQSSGPLANSRQQFSLGDKGLRCGSRARAPPPPHSHCSALWGSPGAVDYLHSIPPKMASTF